MPTGLTGMATDWFTVPRCSRMQLRLALGVPLTMKPLVPAVSITVGMTQMRGLAAVANGADAVSA